MSTWRRNSTATSTGRTPLSRSSRQVVAIASISLRSVSACHTSTASPAPLTAVSDFSIREPGSAPWMMVRATSTIWVVLR